MGLGYEEFWSALPEKALHPLRVPILETFRWIAEPLSAIRLVDVLDGHVTMWDAAHHLRVLDALEVVEPHPDGGDPLARRDIFDLPYLLVTSHAGESE